MKIDKLWNGLKRIANGYYVLEGDLISEETIEINLDDCFVVNGKIRTKKSIVVCCGIEAGLGIEAGDEFGIYAGLHCRITNKTKRKIIAKKRPENIMCGEFEEKSDSEGK